MNVARRASLLAALLATAPALAASVFLNGVKVDGALSNLKIDKCAVEFDARGDVQLDCPGYAVKVEGGAAPAAPAAPRDPAPAPARISRHYFLVTEQAQIGATEYDYDLFINSKFVRKLRSEEEQIVTEVTRHLVPGRNVVTFVAKKRAGKQRVSFSPQHFFRVIIGEGAAGGDKVMIEDAVVSFEKTAAETEDATREFELQAR